ncbi:MAG: carboxylate-amine ligase [Candidatus Marinimicrobia bacterium]|jgi:carboxylate-amine ligase|nr:carboxylate-amine ligase [Candidatus Neomarinimicrobiota bacterium]MBT3617257.1 carboxylate-amine ligase [Candidatus Neomarinimicrobiota bacterium]MBT3828820.1 carboxylate-amine ligase [Candidatus Neomarinimicrobiota bacterium]MBT3997791.1 carboxylate-amine ligase [Candidatus Neomarinimicrobiota bacterium]MBT4280505.1 carboxylate-amine ligase [Candidatus Neomarinimicrobiota bacterium]
MNDIKNLTLGVEEEYQIIDPESRELTSYVGKFLEQGAFLFRDQLQPELLQSQIEIGTNVCQNIQQITEEIRRLRSMVGDLAGKNNRAIIAAGTHPFSQWRDQIVTDKERYHGFFDSMRIVAKRMLIFGMHVHVGIQDKDLRIDVMNQMRYFMPHILSLSTSSPFWHGEDTGFKSYRSIIFEDLPRTGNPEHFDSAADYDSYVDTLIKCGSIDEPTKIWWDIRPHSKFPTLEFRICDCTTKIKEVTAIAALIQALVAKLIQLRRNNLTWRHYRAGFISENKWRAMKDGIQGKLIDLGKNIETPIPQLMEEILEFVDDVVDPLGSRKEIEYIRTIMKEGTSADRQLQKYKENDSMKEVVDMLIENTMAECN